MLSFLCIFSLVACNLGTDDGEETESTPISEAESEIQTLAKTSPYVIIVSKNASDTVHASAAQLQGVIKSLLGYDLKIKDDYLSWSDTASEHEILIGDVSRDEAKKITGLRVDDFSVSTSAKKWIIKGGNEQSTSAAVNYFAANCLSFFEECPSDYSYYSEGTYAVKEITLSGKDISEYVMVYPNNAPICEKYATRIQVKIASLCGTVIPIYKESAVPNDKAIITFGKTASSICSFDTLGYDSHEIAVADGIISFAGGCQNAYYTAIEKFEKKLVKTEELSLTAEHIRTRFDQVSRSDYIQNPDLFVPIWKITHNIGTVSTFEQKIAKFSAPSSSEIFSIIHRGESTYYPENSIESIISAYLAGADAVEIDVVYTKDGVAVLEHDETLERHTNFEQVKGTIVNGIELPTSPNIADWTYDQLSQLRRKLDSTVTEFKIATLEEALIASNGRIFLFIEDKLGKGDILDVCYELMKKTGNYRSVLLGGSGGSGVSVEQSVEMQKKIKDETGITALIFARSNTSGIVNTVKYLKTNAVGPYGILLNGEYAPNNKVSLKTKIDAVKDSAIVGAWTLDNNGTNYENTVTWQEMYDVGYRIIIVNKIFDLLKFSKNKN